MTAVPPPNPQQPAQFQQPPSPPAAQGEYQPFVPPAPAQYPVAGSAPVNPGFVTGGHGSQHRPNERLKAGNRNTLILAGVLFLGAPVVVIGVIVVFLVFANIAYRS